MSSKPPVNRRYHHNHGFLTAASKSTTRHLAALDFLLNIPMASEEKIKEIGMLNAARIRTLDGDNESVNEESIDDASVSITNNNTNNLNMIDDYSLSPVDSVGRKLQGASAPTMRVPPHFRYNMLRVNEQSAVVRHWEDQMLARGPHLGGGLAGQNGQLPLLSSRMFYSRARAYPVAVFSVIKYDAGEEKAKIAKLRAEDQRGLEVFDLPLRDWRGTLLFYRYSYNAIITVIGVIVVIAIFILLSLLMVLDFMPFFLEFYKKYLVQSIIDLNHLSMEYHIINDIHNFTITTIVYVLLTSHTV